MALLCLILEGVVADEVTIHQGLELVCLCASGSRATRQVDEVLLTDKFVEGILFEIEFFIQFDVKFIANTVGHLRGSTAIGIGCDRDICTQASKSVGHRVAGARFNHVRRDNRDIQSLDTTETTPQLPLHRSGGERSSWRTAKCSASYLQSTLPSLPKRSLSDLPQQ